MTDKVVVLVTCGKKKEAEGISATVVEKRLAACVNLVAGIRSLYRWEGKIHNDREYLLIIKTTRERFAALRKEIARLHSYQVPEIICLPIVEGAETYLNWIEKSVRPPRERGRGRR